MIIKILIGIVLYFLLIALLCVFFKGATQMANEFDERQEAIRFLKNYKEKEVNEN